jgi:predicted ArsR family transcriptional regulator
VRFERTSGRTEFAAGRPAKLFRRRHDELSASVPEFAGSPLAAGVVDASRTGRPVADCLGAAAHAAGRRIGERSHRDSAGQTPDEEMRSTR